MVWAQLFPSTLTCCGPSFTKLMETGLGARTASFLLYLRDLPSSCPGLFLSVSFRAILFWSEIMVAETVGITLTEKRGVTTLVRVPLGDRPFL